MNIKEMSTSVKEMSMSVKGVQKVVVRAPHRIKLAIGASKLSADKNFDELNRNFIAIELSTEKFLNNTVLFCEHVEAMLNAGAGLADHFNAIFAPFAGEFDLAEKHPGSAAAFDNLVPYQELMAELDHAAQAELELIRTKIVDPLKEFKEVVRGVRKRITKREHKLIDYDRHNLSLTKLREKRDKNLSDEKKLFKLEQDFETATNEFDHINYGLKQDLPRFLLLVSRFIEPLYHNSFYTQLNIYYMILEKLSSFAEGKYDVSPSFHEIATEYEGKNSDVMQRIGEMAITKRIISTSRLVQSSRALTGGGGLGRSNTTTSMASSLTARAIPPPSRSPSMPPPPYTKAQTPKQYVVALYDFEATSDGDLPFKAGDRIEVVEKTADAEDWWTGKLKGVQGVFPGNYVRDT